MRRTERLFQIVQILRSMRSSVTGKSLAEELEVSSRTLYRDMAEIAANMFRSSAKRGREIRL